MLSAPISDLSRLHPTNRALLNYWSGKAAAGAPPSKSAFDPADIPRLLPDVLLYERRAEDHFRFRVVGTRVAARIGHDPTGGNMLALLGDDFRPAVQAAMNRVLDEPCVQVVTVRDRFPSGRESLVEVVRAPLLDDSGAARFVISSTAELEPLGSRLARAAPASVGEPMADRFVPLDRLLQVDAGRVEA